MYYNWSPLAALFRLIDWFIELPFFARWIIMAAVGYAIAAAVL